MLKSPIVLALAMGHFMTVELPQDPRMAEILLTVAGVNITYGLALAMGLSAAALGAAAILRAGKPIAWDDHELTLAGMFVCAAALLYAARCCVELPVIAATWWWLALAAGVAAVTLRWRSNWLSLIAAVMLVATAAKWIFYDTLGRRLMAETAVDLWRAPAANWQFAAGVALAVAITLYPRMLRARGLKIPEMLDPLAATLSAGMIVWAGSFEIDRYFVTRRQDWPDPWRAMHMGLSLWWAACATATLILGFARKLPALRYFAIVLFALTVGKVLIADMRGVGQVYRVLSFLGLGVLLLGAAWLYHRATRDRQGQGP